MADKRDGNQGGGIQKGGKLGPLENSAAAVDSIDLATREKIDAEELQQARAQIEHLQAEQGHLLAFEEASLMEIYKLKIEIEDCQRYVFKPGGIGEFKKNYEFEKKGMEAKITTQSSDIAELNKTIQNLYDQKRQLNEDIEHVKAALKEKQLAQLREVCRQKENLEKSLQDSQRTIAARLRSEQWTVQNFQEAISEARNAVAEKEAAEKRQKNIEKNCESLVTTINQIIDKASRNVEMEMKDVRKKFKEKEYTLLDQQYKLQEQIEHQIKFNQVLKMRCARLVEKCKDDSQQIENLNLQLHSAVTALEVMGEEIKAKETSVRETTFLKKRIEDGEKELQRHKEKNVQEKNKYESSLEDIVKHFEDQINLLSTANNNPKAN